MDFVSEPSIVTILVLDQQGERIAQSDGLPAGKDITQWELHQSYLDYRSLLIPCDLEEGDYQVTLVVYDYTTQEKLPLVVEGNENALPPLVLGEIEIGD